MQSLFFWNSWPKDYRWLWYFLSALFVASIGLLWFYYFQGADAVISWERIQQQKIIETTVHTFRLGPFQLAVPSESYVIFEFLGGSDIHHNVFISSGFLVIFFMCAIVLLSLITTLERFWYLAGTAIFILFVVTLRLDVLQIKGAGGYLTPIAVMVCYLSASFYFKYFRSHTSFLIRVAVFTAITLLVAIVVVVFSKVNSPLLHLVVTAYTPALVLSTLFLIMVAHEIVVSFVYITNQVSAGKNVSHFAIISFIYIINVILTCLYEIGGINWNFLYINLFLLATVSGILGIWGFRLREPLYENIFPFAPFGAFFFIALGSICFITISQFLGNGNDAAVKIIRYVIIFTHTGFGIIFIIYFFSNFLVIMGNNLPVYKLLYRPTRMPYFTFRFAGLIACLAFLFYSNWRDFVDHGIAGLYNYVGDMHLAEGDETFAQTFFEQSRSLSFQNHRANYQLATIKSSRMSFDGAAYNYQQANGKRPSEFSLVNQGNLNLWLGKHFEALSTFRKAEKVLPGSEVIKNNLGYSYVKLHNLDSASFYLSEARENKLTKSAAEANFIGMAATELIPINADSVMKYFNNRDAIVEGNALAVATLFNQKIEVQSDPLANRTLNLYSATLLNNYINYHVKDLDTTFTARALSIASDSVNFDYREALKSSLAHALYYQGKVYKALEILGELAYLSQSHQGKFNYIMGLWALEQRSPATAASYFSHAETAEYKQAKFYRAIAFTEAGNVNEAVIAWDTVIASGEQPLKDLGTNIKKILLATPAQAMSFNDPDKYQFCRYRLSISDTATFDKLVRSLTNDNYKAQALLDMSTRLYRADRIVPAIRYFNQTSGLSLTDKKLYDDLRHFELLMLASRNEINTLAKQINNNITFGALHQLQKLLYTALIEQASGNVEAAEKIYQLLSKSNPFFEEGIIASAEFFKNKDPKSIRSYNILVDAIYVNPNSIRLLKGYIAEAERMGFDEYAASAATRLKALE
jgi:hypothetical protein